MIDVDSMSWTERESMLAEITARGDLYRWSMRTARSDPREYQGDATKVREVFDTWLWFKAKTEYDRWRGQSFAEQMLITIDSLAVGESAPISVWLRRGWTVTGEVTRLADPATITLLRGYLAELADLDATLDHTEPWTVRRGVEDAWLRATPGMEGGLSRWQSRDILARKIYEYAAEVGWPRGIEIDDQVPAFPVVVLVELPTGQASWHASRLASRSTSTALTASAAPTGPTGSRGTGIPVSRRRSVSAGGSRARRRDERL